MRKSQTQRTLKQKFRSTLCGGPDGLAPLVGNADVLQRMVYAIFQQHCVDDSCTIDSSQLAAYSDPGNSFQRYIIYQDEHEGQLRYNRWSENFS